MFVSHRNIIVRNIHSLFVSICDIYCSINIIELLLLMMCLNKYFQQQQQQQHNNTHTHTNPQVLVMSQYREHSHGKQSHCPSLWN